MRYTNQAELDDDSFFRKKERTADIANYVLLIVILFLNPLISLFIAALFNFFISIRKALLYIYAFVYTVFIVNREYFVRFGENNGDDTVRYVPFISEMPKINFTDSLYIQRDIFSVEPLPRAIWWIATNLGLNIELLVLIQTLLWMFAFICFCTKINERYSFVLVFIGICFFPYSVPYNYFHLYRQSWALCFFMLYVSFFDKKRWRFLFLVLSGLSHLLIVPILIFFEVLAKKINMKNMLVFVPIIIATLFFIVTYEPISNKVIAYAGVENYNYDPRNAVVYLLFFSLIFSFSKNDVLNSDVRWYMYFVILSVYVIALIPYMADIANRYMLLLSHLGVIMFTPLSKKYRWIAGILFVAAVLKLLKMLTSETNNLYQFISNGYFDYFNPFDRLIYFLKNNAL